MRVKYKVLKRIREAGTRKILDAGQEIEVEKNAYWLRRELDKSVIIKKEEIKVKKDVKKVKKQNEVIK